VLLAEIAIALYVRDAFVRPYLGDSLAVVLVYLALRASTRLQTFGAVAVAWLIACAIEFGQLYGLVGKLGIGGSRIARMVLGTGFDPKDFIAYTGEVGIVLLVESLRQRFR